MAEAAMAEVSTAEEDLMPSTLARDPTDSAPAVVELTACEVARALSGLPRTAAMERAVAALAGGTPRLEVADTLADTTGIFPEDIRARAPVPDQVVADMAAVTTGTSRADIRAPAAYQAVAGTAADMADT